MGAWCSSSHVVVFLFRRWDKITQKKLGQEGNGTGLTCLDMWHLFRMLKGVLKKRALLSGCPVSLADWEKGPRSLEYMLRSQCPVSREECASHINQFVTCAVGAVLGIPISSGTADIAQTARFLSLLFLFPFVYLVGLRPRTSRGFTFDWVL